MIVMSQMDAPAATSWWNVRGIDSNIQKHPCVVFNGNGGNNSNSAVSDIVASWKNASNISGQCSSVPPLARAFQNYPCNHHNQPRLQGFRYCHKNLSGCNEQKTGTGGPILCANCGKSGHVYRSCSLPITSFGVICFRWTVDTDAGIRVPQYLMVQRKDSLCFVEFVRGRYDPVNSEYVMHLLRKMTRAEREHIRTLSFPELWHGFWQTDHNKGYVKEYQQAQHKFGLLQRGFHRPADGEFVCLELLLNATRSEHDEREWGFPKGRRNINEWDMGCALREFREETGIQYTDVNVHEKTPPFEEVFPACNKVRYKHVS